MPSRHVPFRLRPLHAVLLALFASGAGAAGQPDASPQRARPVQEVEFSDTFLQGTAGGVADLSRFSKGNPALPGHYRAELYVNEIWLGRADVELRQSGDPAAPAVPCFDHSLLERVGVDLARLPAAASLDGNGCQPLPALVADATASFDNGEQRLDVSVPQAAMVRRARGYVSPENWDDGVPAARLQYNANVYHSDASSLSTTQAYVGLNAGINVGPWRFSHQGSLNRDERQGTRYQSVLTNLQRAIAPWKSQLVIGDAFTDGTLFDSIGFRGVRLASDERMYPESLRGYAPIVRGIARSNARVQVRQQGNILYETTVAPGPFEIDDLYPTGYGGDIEVVVTEADGSVHVSAMPYAAAVNALRAGQSRYSVTAGQYRSTVMQGSTLLLQGTYLHGFANMVTGYGGFVAAQGYGAIAAGIALNTDLGAFGADITHASTRLQGQPDRSGQSVRLSYSKLVAPTNTNVSVAAYRYSSRGYLGLADAMSWLALDQAGRLQSLPTARGKLQLSINQALPAGYGNFYLTGSVQSYWQGSGTASQFQAGYNNAYRAIAYGVSASRQLNVATGKWDTRVMLTVGVPLGKSSHAPYSLTSLERGSDGTGTAQETVTGTLGSDNAFSYSLNAGRSGGASGSANSIGGSASYVSPFATMTASASRSTAYAQAGAGISGGIVAYADGVAFSPTLGDTVAVVEAKDAAGARLANGAGLRVDPWGHAVVSNLVPFARNEIEIDPQGLPLEVELKSTLQRVAPTAGAVVRVRFKTENPGRAAILRTRLPDDAPLPFGAEVFNGDGRPVGTVAQAGRVLVRGLTARWGQAGGDACTLHYDLGKPGNGTAAMVVRDALCTR
ncbi:fimbrial biogenesis outer membrane usher protein [Cupriavidus sp. P-10]|uniref:fimbria/pilus outer membrane usher protein n=1 Tax=unclassified Cupriavidus TaxID=2640874 RepID=UPI001F2D5B41|nr:fimbria/pilus outer membrane usher protein [Cupriavidus sp. P-10]BDB23160.1 fimbrial biogenesis outer membrane usher protein [Cupriavidus sp. P-10]